MVSRSVENTKTLSSYFCVEQNDVPQPEEEDRNDDEIMSEIGGNSTNSDAGAILEEPCFSGGIIDVSSTENIEDNVGEQSIPTTNDFELDYENEYPTDRRILPSEIDDPLLKKAIVEHGSCKPKCVSQFENHEGKPNFLPSYYTYREIGGNIQVPRQLLCYSPSLKKP